MLAIAWSVPAGAQSVRPPADPVVDVQTAPPSEAKPEAKGAPRSAAKAPGHAKKGDARKGRKH